MRKEYLNMYTNTIITMYPIYLKKQLLKKLVEEQLIINNKKKINQLVFNFTRSIDVTEIESIDDKLCMAMEDERVLASIEENEYKKQYRHFVYFECKNIEVGCIETLVSNGQINVWKKDNEPVDEFDKPTIYIEDNIVYLKVVHKLTNDVGNEIVYPILAILDKELGVVEIRLDRVGIAYKNTYFFYKDKIDEMKKYLVDKLGLVLNDIDFKSVVDYIKSEKEDVSIYAQKMSRQGSTAYLEAYEEGDGVMPIIGELNAFIESNENIFSIDEHTQDIKIKLQKFIQEIEVKSDLPIVKVKMDAEDIKFGITHNYKEADYSFFMLYGDLVGDKELMGNVRKYLIECRNELRASITDVGVPTKEM